MSSDPVRGESDGRRFEERRASLRAALRGDDVRVAARAASRLRINGYLLTPDEFVRARAVRRTLGLALIKARLPRPAQVPPREGGVAAPSVARRSWRRVNAAAAAALAVLIALFVFGQGVEPPSGGGAPARTAEPQRALLLTQSRGRTLALPPDVVVEASPTPAPTAQPTAEPTAEPVAIVAATPGPVSTARPSAGSGGSGGGAGGGSGSGAGSGSGKGASPTPAPTPTPRVPPPGFTRLNVIVYDGSSGRPLDNVCVVIGTPDCGPNAPHTAANGRWSADVAASSSATQWTLLYIKTGYVTYNQQITLPGGVSRTYIIYLRRRG